MADKNSPMNGFQFPDVMSLRLAAVYLDMSEQRIRTLSREGTIPGATKDGANAWSFTKAGLEEFKAVQAKTPSTRGGAASKAGKAFVVHVTGEKLGAVKDALSKLGIELEQRYDYDKQRAYQAKRKAAKAAERAAAAQAQPQPEPANA